MLYRMGTSLPQYHMQPTSKQQIMFHQCDIAKALGDELLNMSHQKFLLGPYNTGNIRLYPLNNFMWSLTCVEPGIFPAQNITVAVC